MCQLRQECFGSDGRKISEIEKERERLPHLNRCQLLTDPRPHRQFDFKNPVVEGSSELRSQNSQGTGRMADRVLVLQPGVRPEPLNWESRVQDIGPPETSRPHIIIMSTGKSSPRDLCLSAKA